MQAQILRYSEDNEVRSATLYNICFAYLKNGGHENAPVYLLDGDEKKKVCETA